MKVWTQLFKVGLSHDTPKPTTTHPERLKSAWESAQSDQHLHCVLKRQIRVKQPPCLQQRLRSGWADAQADQILSWVHMRLCWFCSVVANFTNPLGNKFNPTALKTAKTLYRVLAVLNAIGLRWMDILSWEAILQYSFMPTFTKMRQLKELALWAKNYFIYHIYLAIRRGFPSLEWLLITKSILWNFAIIQILPFLNNPKDPDPSYMTDLDFWDCFVRKKYFVW